MQTPIWSLFTGKFPRLDSSTAEFEEEHAHEQGFSQHYKTHIAPFVDEFEERRVAVLSRASKFMRMVAFAQLFAILGGLIYLVLYDFSPESVDRASWAVLILFFALICAGFCFVMMVNSYKSSIKDDIFPNILSFYGDFSFSPICHPRSQELVGSKIIPQHDGEISEDEVQGEYKGVKIDLFETSLSTKREFTDKDGMRCEEYKTIFRGLIINLSMHKNFAGQTVVLQNVGLIGEWLKKKSLELDRVKLEDPTFEKKFDAYSDNQVEARYLLTTAFMERLVELNDLIGGEGIQCSFYNNSLLIVIPMKEDLFEPGSVFEPEDFIDDAKQLLKEMNIIFSIIEILKLDQDLGM